MRYIPCRAAVVVLCLAAFATTLVAEGVKVFPVTKGVAKRRKAVEYLMSLSDKKLRAMVPLQSGIYFTDCPNCETGAQDRANWKWVPRKPRSIECTGCGATYPKNRKYPDAKFIEIAAPGGPHRYHYYKRKDGYRIFLRAAADYMARDWLAKRCRDLGNLYHETRDEKYARKAAVILVRFAELYPTWAHKFDYPFRQKKFAPYSQNRIKGVGAYRVSRWSWWAYMGVSLELLEGYERIRDWPGLKRMARGKARKMIEQDLFTAQVEFVMGFRETNSNMSPVAWKSFTYAGRVLNRPDWVRATLKRINTFMETRFLYDGYWMETAPSYCGQVVGLMRRNLAVFSGYVPPKDAPEELAAEIEKGLAATRAHLKVLEDIYKRSHMPHGGLITVNDTWARRRRTRKATRSDLLPGLGVAILGGGEDKRQMYAWLNYTSGRQHKQYDALSMGLFANDHELLRDIGYTHTRWRYWSLTTASHNTVVVDGVNSGRDDLYNKHRLRVFATDGKGFHLAEAESDAAYPGTTKRYRRTLVCVGDDARDAYLIDLFQVYGGAKHDYVLHGTAAEDSTARISGPRMRAFKGTLMNAGARFAYPQGESFRTDAGAEYGFVRNLKAGKASGWVTLEMRLSSDKKIGTRTHLLAPGGGTVYLGEAPRLRQAERKDHLLGKYYAPFFCMRRKGRNLKSHFLAVHEPLNGKAKVRGVSVKDVKGGVLVTVDRGRLGKDHFAMSLGGPPATFTTLLPEGRLQFSGMWGLARTRGGRARSLHLVGGKQLSLGNAKMKARPGWQGAIKAFQRGGEEGSRGSFDVAEAIGPKTSGTALLIEFPDKMVRGYTVTRVEPLARGTRLHVAEDPACEIKGRSIRLTSYPQREIKGTTLHYQLPVRVSMTVK